MERQEAQASLASIEKAMALTRRAVSRAGSGYFFILWGFVWLTGFLGNELLAPVAAGYLWLALDTLGILGSIVVGIRLGRRVRSAGGLRAGLRLLAL